MYFSQLHSLISYGIKMCTDMFQTILTSYGLRKEITEVSPFGQGLINHTWSVQSGADRYILQRINDNVFKKPEDIAANIRKIGDYLSEHAVDYLFVKPRQTVDQNEFLYIADHGYFRLFPFVKD